MPVRGWVKLSGPAPAGGAVVGLSSSNPSLVRVPPMVTVAAGERQAYFVISAGSPTASGRVDLTGAFGGTTRGESVGVEPAPEIRRFWWPSQRGSQAVEGGEGVTGKVELAHPAPDGGVVVALTLEGPPGTDVAAIASVPGGVRVPQWQRERSFQVTTREASARQVVRVCASVPGQSSRCNSLTVTPAAGFQMGMQVSAQGGPLGPSATVGAGRVVQIRVSLRLRSSARMVGLTSSHPGVVPVPTSLRIEPDQAQGTERVTTREVKAETVVTLSATYGGLTRTATVTVQPEATPR